MLSSAQLAANAANAQSSTGPRTEAGKAASSKNATKFGLFSADFVRPDEQSQYDDLAAAVQRELAPAGILEQNLADEIRRAMWRLRRCGIVEAELAVPFPEAEEFHCVGENPIPDPMSHHDWHIGLAQKSVDRARSQAHRLLHKCTAELRRLQTERQFNQASDISEPGLADWRAVRRAMLTPAASTKTQFAKQTRPEAEATPRNTECPCGSGLKHKRCCGKTAAPVLCVA